MPRIHSGIIYHKLIIIPQAKHRPGQEEVVKEEVNNVIMVKKAKGKQ